MMKNYYRLISEVDATCGSVLGELKSQGLLEQTLVIFTTDNGYFHGEHGLADKWYPYQESIRVPLIIRDPRSADKRRATICDEIVLSADLAPTILTAAEIDVPVAMQGKDVSPLYLADSKVPWRNEFFYEHPTIRETNFIPASKALVGKDWKYVFWPEHDYDQLFDLASDPSEEFDLARDSAHATRLSEMRSRMAELEEGAK